MATVHIPAVLRALTSGASEVAASGTSLGAVIEDLDALYPGLKSRLVEGDRLRSGMAVFVDGAMTPPRLSLPVSEGAEIYFAPAISGG